MGTSGMRYSLQSREIIADSIETVTQGQWYDANISLVPAFLNPADVARLRQKYAWLSYRHGPIQSSLHNGLRG